MKVAVITIRDPWTAMSKDFSGSWFLKIVLFMVRPVRDFKFCCSPGPVRFQIFEKILVLVWVSPRFINSPGPDGFGPWIHDYDIYLLDLYTNAVCESISLW